MGTKQTKIKKLALKFALRFLANDSITDAGVLISTANEIEKYLLNDRDSKATEDDDDDDLDIRPKNSFAYFAHQYCGVTLNTEQNSWANHVAVGENRILIGADRRTGKTTFMSLLALEQSIFNSNSTTYFGTCNRGEAKSAIKYICDLHQTLSDGVAEVQITSQRNNKITFDNGSTILVSGNPIQYDVRGRFVNLMLMDDVFFITQNDFYNNFGLWIHQTNTKLIVTTAKENVTRNIDLFRLHYDTIVV